jgi:hypothetical protein
MSSCFFVQTLPLERSVHLKTGRSDHLTGRAKVAHFKELVRARFFDECGFYRAEKGFVLQGGARLADGSTKESPLMSLLFESG